MSEPTNQNQNQTSNETPKESQAQIGAKAFYGQMSDGTKPKETTTWEMNLQNGEKTDGTKPPEKKEGGGDGYVPKAKTEEQKTEGEKDPQKADEKKGEEPAAKPDEGSEPKKTDGLKKEDLKLPEKALLTESHVERVASFAQERGLSKEQAQAVLEYANTLVSEDRLAGINAMDEMQKTIKENWRKEAMSDPEFGGKNFEASAEKVRRYVWDTVGTKGVEFLDKSGLGDNPMVLKLLLPRAETMGDPKIIKGGAATTLPTKRPEQIMFGSTTPGPTDS